MLIFCILVINNTVKNFSLLFQFAIYLPFIIFFIEVDKNSYLKLCQIGKKIAFMPFDEFFDYLT